MSGAEIQTSAMDTRTPVWVSTAEKISKSFWGEARNFSRKFRAFLNLWFAKPMVCMRVTLHENDGNQKTTETTKTTQTATLLLQRNHGNDENHGNPECKPRVPQNTRLEIPESLRWSQRQLCIKIWPLLVSETALQRRNVNTIVHANIT